MKRALLIAFHDPPARGSSGIQRTLGFSRYLGKHGWEPLVLTANPRAYPTRGDDQLRDVPRDIVTERAFALDTSRHLAVKGRYLEWMASPDRWVTWWLGGVFTGLRLIRRYKPNVLWSTFPIPTAHLIGRTLHNLTGVPWVADFRDSMTEESYPTDPRKRALYQRIERSVVSTASLSVFTSPGTLRMYKERYPELPESRWRCVLNGFDEESFSSIGDVPRSAPGGGKPVVLLHSGLLYPSERDPRQFFVAVRQLVDEGVIRPSDVVIRFRASGYESVIQTLIDEAGIGHVVRLEPMIGYREALTEMLSADALLIFQAGNCNHQIPAKLYEYLRAQRPVLALTDPIGDTAMLLKSCGINTIARLDSAEDIKRSLVDLLVALRRGTAEVASAEVADKFARSSQAGELARLFDTLVRRPGVDRKVR